MIAHSWDICKNNLQNKKTEYIIMEFCTDRGSKNSSAQVNKTGLKWYNAPP